MTERNKKTGRPAGAPRPYRLGISRLKWAVSVIAAVLLFWLYIIIFGFSSQDGETSGSLSFYISSKCVEAVNALSGSHWTEVFREELALFLEHPVRKAAHFAEYACMGVLVFCMWRPWKERGRRLYLFILAWVALSAGADELHQYFVPGRYASFADVLLDTCGGGFALIGCTLIEKWVYKIRSYCAT